LSTSDKRGVTLGNIIISLWVLGHPLVSLAVTYDQPADEETDTTVVNDVDLVRFGTEEDPDA